MQKRWRCLFKPASSLCAGSGWSAAATTHLSGAIRAACTPACGCRRFAELVLPLAAANHAAGLVLLAAGPLRHHGQQSGNHQRARLLCRGARPSTHPAWCDKLAGATALNYNHDVAMRTVAMCTYYSQGMISVPRV